MDNRNTIARGFTSNQDEQRAVQELWQQIGNNDPALIVFFCSTLYGLDKIEATFKQLGQNVPVIGCSTAGEIGQNGYSNYSITAFSLPRSTFNVAVKTFQQIRSYQISDIRENLLSLKSELRHKVPDHLPINSGNTFGFLLIDGLSLREELFASGIYSTMREFSIFGGSAADQLTFKKTSVYFDGQFHSESAVFCLIQTQRPFYVFKTQHFTEAKEKLVVTEAIPEKRIVTEINGEPAAQEFARIAGLQVRDLNPNSFAYYPAAVKIGNECFIRSVQQVNPDYSLTFYCAIDEGIVLTVAQGGDIVQNVTDLMEDLNQKIGPPQIIISCDCILRRLEMIEKNVIEQTGNILKKYNSVGFSTYGEQFQAMHINQTLTGVAIS